MMHCLETGRGLERAQNGSVLENWLEVSRLDGQRRETTWQTRDNMEEEKRREGIFFVPQLT